MTALVPSPAGLPTAIPDPVARCLDVAFLASHRLFMATLGAHDRASLRSAIDGAAEALAGAAALRDAVAEDLAPASQDEILDEGMRLLRAWPQDRKGDLAGFGAELGDLLQERCPGRRALRQACRTLKLTRVHPPSIAEVMAAVDAAERALAQRADAVAKMPARIAAAEALLDPPPPRGVPGRESAGAAA